nr:photosystem II protein Z [Ostreobium quekettii]UXE30717.1 photosystem II protein Z [Ostreobium quekettii]UXE30793.1 photosystem II protein Z [Ostreobium quekettii]UXE30869.1 photosystem II protein Z [Ostreobium quekettii]
MITLFQLVTFALVALSFLLVVGVPVAFAYPEGWAENKRIVFSGIGLWIFLVFSVGVLNSFAV